MQTPGSALHILWRYERRFGPQVVSGIQDLLTIGARNEENIPLCPCTASTSTVPDGHKTKSIPQQLANMF